MSRYEKELDQLIEKAIKEQLDKMSPEELKQLKKALDKMEPHKLQEKLEELSKIKE